MCCAAAVTFLGDFDAVIRCFDLRATCLFTYLLNNPAHAHTTVAAGSFNPITGECGYEVSQQEESAARKVTLLIVLSIAYKIHTEHST